MALCTECEGEIPLDASTTAPAIPAWTTPQTNISISPSTTRPSPPSPAFSACSAPGTLTLSPPRLALDPSFSCGINFR